MSGEKNVLIEVPLILLADVFVGVVGSLVMVLLYYGGARRG